VSRVVIAKIDVIVHDGPVATGQTVIADAQRSRVDLAYETLARGIFDRVLKPGDRLGIDAAARRLQMSITPVREALARLASDGLLTQVANQGYRVAPLLTATEFHALFTARRVLELEALRPRPDGTGVAARLSRPLAVTNRMAEHLEELTAGMRAVNPGPDYAEFGEFSRLDRDFHQALVDASANRFLASAWRGLHFHLHVSRLYAGAGVIDYDEGCHEHDAIVEAVRRRDAAALELQVTRHILSAESRLSQLLNETL